jgi:uncharacterized membrane protein YkvA (DUF1232 family)
LRLAWKLIFDKRVPKVLRLLVPLALLYALPGFPNILKDSLHPILGRFDDLIVLGFSLLLLTKLAPKHVVDEHMGIQPANPRPQEEDPSKVVEGSAQILEED